METDDEECPNFVLVRTGGWEFVFAADANPTNCCCMQSSAAQRCNEIPALANASSLAAWTDLGPKGLMCIVPSAVIQAPTQISSCMETTSLTLDGASSTGGGIKLLTYEWRALPAACDNYFIINPLLIDASGAPSAMASADVLHLSPSEIAGGRIFSFQLIVRNFLGKVQIGRFGAQGVEVGRGMVER